MSAIERAKLGERTVCIDEMTGIQALERLAPDLPLRPGKVRREFEYIRHGTQSNCQFRCCYRSSHLSDLWQELRSILPLIRVLIESDAQKWDLITDCLNKSIRIFSNEMEG